MTSKQIERCGGAYLAMWKLVAVAAMVAIGSGCKNDAITYAQTIDPDAACEALSTDRGLDSAVCRIGRDVWTCIAFRGQVPKCIRSDEIPQSRSLPTYVEAPSVAPEVR